MDLCEFCAFALQTFRALHGELDLVVSLFDQMSRFQENEEINTKDLLFCLIASCALSSHEKAQAVFRKGDMRGRKRMRVEETLSLLLASQDAMNGGLSATAALVRALDTDGDGRLSWQEFRDGILKTPELLQCFGSLLGTSSSNSAHFQVSRIQAAQAMHEAKLSHTSIFNTTDPLAQRTLIAPARARLSKVERRSIISTVSTSQASSPTGALRDQSTEHAGLLGVSRKQDMQPIVQSRADSMAAAARTTQDSHTVLGISTMPSVGLQCSTRDSSFGGIKLFSSPLRARTRASEISDSRHVYSGRRVTHKIRSDGTKSRLAHGKQKAANYLEQNRAAVNSVLSKPGAQGLNSLVLKLRKSVNRERSVRAQQHAVLLQKCSQRPSSAGNASGIGADTTSRAVLRLRKRPQTAYIVTQRMGAFLEDTNQGKTVTQGKSTSNLVPSTRHA
jgi:hypothetical protein